MVDAKQLFRELETPVTALEKSRGVVNRLVAMLVQNVRMMEAGPVSGNVVVGVYEQLISARQHFDRMSDVDGLRDAFADEFGTNGQALLAASDAVRAAVVDAIDFIALNFPGEDDWVTFTGNGVQTRSYSASETALLRTSLNDIVGLVIDL